MIGQGQVRGVGGRDMPARAASSLDLVRAGGELEPFARAATALGMSPQMVARHVAFLEVRLGSGLLNRTTRRRSLTRTGEADLEHRRAVLAETERLACPAFLC